ncbi:potassium two pore domain channel subfamily K member galene isoform X2 [Bombus vancouverensis nearcticus]|uniref:potassium two pore domain channel subfamily K member galene isoform X2 n=1 Tax=Bombus vancouverensis nearcticus TaxID=2705178 RepID=UPI00402BC65C
MPRSRPEAFELMVEAEKPSKCIRFLRFLWKFFRCVFSHVSLVSLVVLYCLIGAYAFEALEATHEKEIKKSIKDIRGNVAEQLWKITKEVEVLIRENWTDKALRELKSFENNLVCMMEKEGWDGSEGEDDIQWTFAGALFYSIVVITTIGYGHIAPKTKNGKVVTIFYAIVGIPLMLLCLSNIGDIMASSFRFLYWRVCCYICTKPPRKRRPRSHFVRSYSMKQPGRYGGSRVGFGRSIRVSQRSADSALGLSETLTRSSYFDVDNKYNVRRYEDSELKRPSSFYPSSANPNFGFKSATVSRYSDLPMVKSSRASPKMTTQSLDRKLLMRSPNDTDRSPVLCNQYALDDLEDELRRWHSSAENKTDLGNTSKSRVEPEAAETLENVEKQAPLVTRSLPRRCLSMEGATSNYRTNLAQPLRPSPTYLELENSRRSQFSRSRRYKTNYPTGFGDFVPAYKLDAHKGIAVCSLYLLFGIALLAMSFNLVQEEVINNVKNVAKRLGIIKESDDEEDADDYDAYDVEYNDEVDNELEGYVLDTPRCHSMTRNVRGISVA